MPFQFELKDETRHIEVKYDDDTLEMKHEDFVKGREIKLRTNTDRKFMLGCIAGGAAVAAIGATYLIFNNSINLNALPFAFGCGIFEVTIPSDHKNEFEEFVNSGKLTTELQREFENIENHLKVLGITTKCLDDQNKIIQLLKGIKIESVEICSQEIAEKAFEDMYSKEAERTRIPTTTSLSGTTIGSSGNVKSQEIAEMAFEDMYTTTSLSGTTIGSSGNVKSRWQSLAEMEFEDMYTTTSLSGTTIGSSGNVKSQEIAELEFEDMYTTTSLSGTTIGSSGNIIDREEIIYDVNQTLGDRVYVGRIQSATRDKKKYAVKLRTIESSLFEDEFLNETEIANQLDGHVNIVRYKKHHIGFIVQERTSVFVTQLCNNEKLENLLPTFSFEQKKILLIQLCHGLKYIHDNQIAHRNLTPSNVLLSLDGKNIKIMDFGISKKFALDEKKIITTSSGFIGNLGWVASEMCSDNRSKEFEAWVMADIYSLGLLIYYIFTDGKHPYQGDANDKHQSIKEKKQPDFSVIENDKEFHDRYLLIELLKDMLSHEPDARPEITQILQHCFTWNAVKKISFIYVCLRYFEQPCDEDSKKSKWKAKRQLQHNGTVEQRMAYIDNESIDNYSSDDSEEFFQFDRSGGAPKDNDDLERTKEEEKALERIHEITGGTWVELIKKILEDPNSGNNERPYENSLTDLVRYIRNTHEYYNANINDKPEEVKLKLGSKNKGMWSFFASNFPEFFPHLFNLMKDELKGDDKEMYLQEEAKNCELPQK